MIAVNAVLAVSFGLAVQLGHAIGRYHVAMLLPCCLTTLFVHCRFTFGSAIWPFGSATWPCHWAVLFGCFIGRCGLLFVSAIGHVVWLHHWWCGMSFGSGIWLCYRLSFFSTAEGGSKKKPPAGDSAISLVEFVRLTLSSVDINDAAVAARKHLRIPSGNSHLNNNGRSMSSTSSDGMESAPPSFGMINSV